MNVKKTLLVSTALLGFAASCVAADLQTLNVGVPNDAKSMEGRRYDLLCHDQAH